MELSSGVRNLLETYKKYGLIIDDDNQKASFIVIDKIDGGSSVAWGYSFEQLNNEEDYGDTEKLKQELDTMVAKAKYFPNIY